MEDSALFVVILLNLALGGVMTAVYWVRRRRDAKAIQQIRREGAQNLKEAVGLSEQMYKVLSKEIQDLRQEIESLSAPAVVHMTNGHLDKRFHVVSLAARGLSLEEITDKVDIPKGEAELILRVNRLKKARGNDDGHATL